MSVIWKKRFKFLGLVLTLGIILLELFFVLYQTNLFTSSNFGAKYKVSRSLTSVNQIKPWMTFGYLNVVFSLPSEFFQNEFNITNSHYPNLQIGHFAKSQKLDNQELVNKIKQSLIAAGRH